MPRPNGYQSLHTSVISEHGIPVRGADPHRGDAPARGGRHRGALEVQGRARRRPARRALLPVDAPAARSAAGGPRPAGVHPEPEDRPLPGGGLHLHAEGRGASSLPRGATPVDFAYSDPHRRRPPVRRRARQRQDGAAAHPPEERRHRRDRHAAGPQAEPRLARASSSTSRARNKIKHVLQARGADAQHRARAAGCSRRRRAASTSTPKTLLESDELAKFAVRVRRARTPTSCCAHIGYGKLSARTVLQKAGARRRS